MNVPRTLLYEPTPSQENEIKILLEKRQPYIELFTDQFTNLTLLSFK